MGEPGDAVRLPAAGRVLDQVVPPRSFDSGSRNDLPYRVELVVAGEDHRLLSNAPLAALPILDLLILPLDEHEVAEDVEEAVAPQDVVPEVADSVTRRVHGV